jgi:hypothetical protein
MPPKKAVESNKPVIEDKNVKSYTVTDDSDDDSNIVDIEMDNVNEHVNQSDEKKKNDKKKVDYEEINSNIEESIVKIKTFIIANKDLEKKINENNKLIDKELKQIELNQKLIPKTLEIKFKEEMKIKKKRENNGKGINEKRPVPAKLRTYLNLDDNVLLARTEVHSLFSDKIIADGLKKDKQIEITPTFSKYFSIDKIKAGDTFEPKGVHSILKLIYDNC